MAVISDCTTFALDHDARGYWISIAHIGATRPIPRQRVEYALLTLFTLCCWLTRRELRPLAVELTTPQPAATAEAPYHVAFGMLPRFGQAANRFLLAEADLRTDIPTHNPSLWSLHERLVETELDHLGQSLTSTRVRTEVARILHQGEPRREDVAARLHLTDRTLQRRLHAAGLNYKDILVDVRRSVAQQYLRDTGVSLTRIATILGYSDLAAFSRSFHREFGVSPRHWRQVNVGQSVGLG